jgi:hypothetical protein
VIQRHHRVLVLHQALAQFAQQRVLVGEVAVERRRRQPGALAHQVGGQALDAHIRQGLGRDLQDPLIGLGGPLLGRLLLGGQRGRASDGLGHLGEGRSFGILPDIFLATKASHDYKLVITT